MGGFPLTEIAVRVSTLPYVTCSLMVCVRAGYRGRTPLLLLGRDIPSDIRHTTPQDATVPVRPYTLIVTCMKAQAWRVCVFSFLSRSKTFFPPMQFGAPPAFGGPQQNAPQPERRAGHQWGTGECSVQLLPRKLSPSQETRWAVTSMVELLGCLLCL